MKLLLILSAILFSPLNSMASDTTLFLRPVSYNEVFDIAKKEKKLVMLYFHFDGCGACRQMEKYTFKNGEVADFYNATFVCKEVNTLKGEGLEVNAIYKIKLHPTFLFLDEKGNIIEKVVGFQSAENFLKYGQNSLDSSKTFLHFEQQYQDGNRDPDFLFDYCYKLNVAHDLDSAVINQYLKTQSVQDLEEEKNIRFIYEFAVHDAKSTVSVNSTVFNFLLENRDKFNTYFDKEQVDTRIVWIANGAVYKAIETCDEEAFNYALEVLRKFDNGQTYRLKRMNGNVIGIINSRFLVLSSQMAYYQACGEENKYEEVLEQYVEKVWNDPNELNMLAWKYYEQVGDRTKLGKALAWSKRSVELSSTYAYTDTYACLLYKLGKYDEALIYAEKAIELAKKENRNYKETEALVVKIKQSQKN